MSDVLTEVEGRIGRIRLNRPKAIHALTKEMCSAMVAALIQWKGDDEVGLIMIDHAEGRGFCAGGDVRMLAESGSQDGAEARAFFHEEYRLNHFLFTYDKPTVAFMDGVTMGGGVGISQPCKYRVATENTRFAMPETAIGLFPDVGGGWYLSRLPGRVGQYLALTGARLDGAECLYLGLATHYIPSERLEEVKGRIIEDPSRIEGILGQVSVTAPEPKIADAIARINKAYSGSTLEEIFESLGADESEWAASEAATLSTKSPQACKVSLRLLERGARMEHFADEMRQEYAIAARVVQRHDFIEGVRAVLIDRDNQPKWDPQSPEGVTDGILDAIFAPLPKDEEWTPLSSKRK